MIYVDVDSDTHTYLEWAGITAEDYGLRGGMSELTANALAANDQGKRTSADSDTAAVTTRTRGRPFQKGVDGRRNTAGRPPKGASMPEKLRIRVEKDADHVVDAVMARLLRDDAVGNRAFADVRDTVYGIPKQTLVLEQGESPLAALLTDLAQLPYVDGEATLLDDNPAP